MTLWLFLALMTVAAVAAVVWPLIRHGVATRSGSDVVVYRDQLDEVGRDLAAGLIGKTEAEAARVEISRRLIAAADAAQKQAAQPEAKPIEWRRWAIAAVTLLLVPTAATGLYLRIGSPGLAGEPLSARMQAPAQGGDQKIDKLVAQVEQHLQQNPNDGRGWQVLAPVYMQLGRYTDSANAWRNAIRLLGDSADRWANLGEALTAEASGIVTDDAKKAFVRAVTTDSTTVSARYYLGLSAEQDGKRDKAAKLWRDLIADAPPGAQWVGTVKAALARVEGKSIAALPGPSAGEIQAAEKKPPAEQNTMVRGMVERLAERLKQDGADLNGWVQLVHSYKVMGEPEKEKAAVADAKRALAADPEKSKKLDDALKEIAAGKNPGAAAESPPASANRLPGPTPAQMLAAAEEPAVKANSTINGMVERLAEKLKKDGSDPQGWARLIRSYKVLGEAEKEKAAMADAKRALANDPAKLKQLDDTLAELDKMASAPAAKPAPLPGPTPAQMLAAAQKPPGQQDASVRSMVDGLVARLKKDRTDLNGWLMLVRSYKVMNEPDKAKGAVAEAKAALGNDPEKSKQLDAALAADVNGPAPAAPPPQQNAQGAGAATTGQHAGETIDVMVEHLHEKLQKSGDSPDGWLMLIRSYLTMKQDAKATAAVKEARKALASDPQKLQAFDAALKHYKIDVPQ